MLQLKGKVTEVREVPESQGPRGTIAAHKQCTIIEEDPEMKWPNAVVVDVYDQNVVLGDICTVEITVDVQFNNDKTRKYNIVRAKNYQCVEQAGF